MSPRAVASIGGIQPSCRYLDTFWELHHMTLSRVLEIIEMYDFQTSKRNAGEEYQA